MKKEMVELFKAFADENRLEIIKLLIKGESCGCTIIDKLPITQPTMSYHLNILNKAGLTNCKREGNWKKHYIDFNKIDELITFLQDLKTLEGRCDL